MSTPPVHRPAVRQKIGARRSIIGTVLATLLLGALVPAPGVAAETPAVIADPGPAGDFAWKGFNWEKRRYGGGPNFNGKFDAANVSSPDAKGHVTLTLTNPTGQAPIGAELFSTRRGFGYGTYSTTVEKNLSSLQKEVVWGCLFTYDASAAPGYNEVDLCEASAWGGGTGKQVWPITQGHGYWFDASKPPGAGNDTTVFGVTDHPVLTHRLVWEPKKLTFETFAGEGSSGPLLKRTVLQGEKVPEPAREAVHFNLWVVGGGGGDPAHVKPEEVVVRDFSFTPAGALAAPPVVAPVPAPAPVPVPTPSAAPMPGPAPVPTTAPVPTPSAAPAPVTPTPAPTTPTPTPTKPPAPKPTAAPTTPVPTKPAAPKPTPTKPAVTKPAPTKPVVTKPAAVRAPITLTSRSSKTRGVVSTTLTWSGAKGATVTLVSNGVRRTVKNTGSTTTRTKAASVRYQICVPTHCSPVVRGGR